MRFDPGNEIYEMVHNGTKYTRGTTNESAWPFRRLRCRSSHCLLERRFGLRAVHQTMWRVAPCASKREARKGLASGF